jgi:hypothetical protein
MKTFLTPILSMAPLLVYAGMVVAVIVWMRWRRKTKWPFKESDKLLRMPGESLKKEVAKAEENFAGEFVGGAIASLVAIPAFYQAFKLGGSSDVPAFTGGMVAFFFVLWVSAWRIGKLARRRADYHIGWFGERIVADHLRPLQVDGYRIFHDVPCEGSTGRFNIDHVTVGPTGVAVIETKTKRKRTSKNAATEHKPEHKVNFDGIHLHWPGGKTSDDAIKQVHGNAKWLIEWIAERTGLKVSAKRIVAIPGWWVDETPKTPNPGVRVIPPHFLLNAIKGHGQVALSAAQIDLVARQLEAKCRDVED